MRSLLLALTAALILAAPAQAVTIVSPDGRVAQPYQRWADRMLIPTVPGTVTLARTACPLSDGGLIAACTLAGPAAIYTQFRPDRYMLTHELGHVFDDQTMTPAARAAFQAITADQRVWDTSDGPMERFAEAYGLCARRTHIRKTWTSPAYDLQITPRQHERDCALIRQAAAG